MQQYITGKTKIKYTESRKEKRERTISNAISDNK